MSEKKTINIKSAEILCVGTEILIGDIVNTNAAYISRQLAMLGISQYYQGVVGDNPERLENAIRDALSRSDLLIMSGGLGPTYDDLTKETAARCMGRELYLDQRSLERIKAHFVFRGRQMTKNNEKQAYIPRGSVIFDNNAGTAPGCAIEDYENGKIIIMLPGPPFELIRMFTESVIPYLSAFTGKVFVSKNVNIFGMGESAVENELKTLMMEATNPTVATYCGEGEVRLRVTASGATEAECALLCDDMIERIRKTAVNDFIYGIDTSIAQATVQGYKAKNKTLAVTESCTGGLISKRLTDVSGCSDMFGYGAVTYANEAKMTLLGVSEQTLAQHGAVSAQTACEMAQGIRRLSGADVGISTTGIAGPTGGTDKKPVGLVYIGVSSEKGTVAHEFRFTGDRDRVRLLASGNALDLALKELKKLV